jgi:hypothetical protein
MLYKSQTLSVAIDMPFKRAYEFLADPANMPKWATAFCLSMENADDKWIAETPIGRMSVRFVEKNNFGVLDHYVAVPSGPEMLNPMRLISNRSGSELHFTLFQATNMSDAQFAEDQELVRQDLNNLKAVLEKSG